MPDSTTTRPYRKIAPMQGACRVCDEVHPLTDQHGHPSYINKYGIPQKANLLPIHGPQDNRCTGSHTEPTPWLEASGLPGWDEMSDLDRGAALMFVRKVHWEHSFAYARENYPARYVDDERLRGLDERDACRHASLVAGRWHEANDRLGEDEVQRLYDLALEHDRARVT